LNLINFDADLIDRLPVRVWESQSVRIVTPQEVGALSFHDREVCGVLVGDPDHGCLLLQLPNTSSRPDHNFAISPESLIFLEEENVRFQGIWHSHPPIIERRSKSKIKMEQILSEEDRLAGPRPSSFDLDYHPVSKRLFIWYRGTMREFNLDGKELREWTTESAVVLS
jgi:proteasome lid subunit RPN8/RPN11